jgi:hypothetical protein
MLKYCDHYSVVMFRCVTLDKRAKRVKSRIHNCDIQLDGASGLMLFFGCLYSFRFAALLNELQDKSVHIRSRCCARAYLMASHCILPSVGLAAATRTDMGFHSGMCLPVSLIIMQSVKTLLESA